MKIINNKQVQETQVTHTLDNGLQIIISHKPGFKNSVSVLGTPFGAKHLKQIVNNEEIIYPSGAAHFLEHKLFEKQDIDILSVFSEMGANANAFTSYSETVYYFSTPQDIYEPLKLLINFVYDLDITEASVEKEKGIIIEELKMYREMPLFRLAMDTLDNLYINHPLQFDIGGSIKSVSQTTLKDLESAYKANYDPSQMILSIVSPIDPEVLIAFIEEQFKDIEVSSKLSVENKLIDEPVEVKETYSDIKMPVNAQKLSVAYKQKVDLNNEKEATQFNLLIQILLDMNFSKVNPKYQEWLDNKWINDAFSYQSDFGLDYGYIQFISETNNEKEFINLMDQMIEQMEVNEALLKQLKKRYIGEYITLFSDFESLSITNFRAVVANFDLFELIEWLEALNVTDLECAKEAITSKNKTIVKIF